MQAQTTENNYSSDQMTFEKVWAMFQETDRKFQETDRLIKELREERKETDRLIQETARQMKETDRQMKETDRRIGDLGNRFGELAEHLVGPSIMEKFNEQGFNFTRRSQDIEIREPNNPNALTEVDILLENGDVVIAVEVKSKPKEADVDKHVKRMEVLRLDADRRGDTRKYCGAVAGAIMSQALRGYTIQNGFYLIEQSGDTVKLAIPKGFIPREW